VSALQFWHFSHRASCSTNYHQIWPGVQDHADCAVQYLGIYNFKNTKNPEVPVAISMAAMVFSPDSEATTIQMLLRDIIYMVQSVLLGAHTDS